MNCVVGDDGRSQYPVVGELFIYYLLPPDARFFYYLGGPRVLVESRIVPRNQVKCLNTRLPYCFAKLGNECQVARLLGYTNLYKMFIVRTSLPRSLAAQLGRP